MEPIAFVLVVFFAGYAVFRVLSLPFWTTPALLAGLAIVECAWMLHEGRGMDEVLAHTAVLLVIAIIACAVHHRRSR